MTIEPIKAPLLAAVLTAALILPAAAEAPIQPGMPNEVAGYPTNAFLPGFPQEFDGMARSSIQSRPQEGRIMAIYGTPEDDRNVQVVDFHPELTRVWSEPLGLDHIAPSELSRLLGEQGFEFLGGSVAEG